MAKAFVLLFGMVVGLLGFIVLGYLWLIQPIKVNPNEFSKVDVLGIVAGLSAILSIASGCALAGIKLDD